MADSKPGNPNWVKGGPSPNPGGRPKGIYTQALRKLVDPDELAKLAWGMAKGGDPKAIADIYARLEGKPAATITLEGNEDRPLHVRRSEREWEKDGDAS